jgi:hypothetical protein
MAGHYALSLVATVIMLDQHWLAFYDISDLPDDDLNAATIFAAVGLSRSAPAPVEQCGGRRYARTRRHGLLAADARKHLDA